MDLYPGTFYGWFWKRQVKWNKAVVRYGLQRGAIKRAAPIGDVAEGELSQTKFSVEAGNVLPWAGVSIDLWIVQLLTGSRAKTTQTGRVGDPSSLQSFIHCLEGMIKKLPNDFTMDIRLCDATRRVCDR